MNPVSLNLKTIAGLCLTLLMAAAQAASPIVAGYVTKVRGEVLATLEANRQPLALGHALHQGSRVLTGTNARLEARMKDGSVLTLGERTEFVIEQVSGATPTSQATRFELLKGAFRAITPAPAGNTAALQWQVRTPVAIIGVRGTEVWGGLNLLNAGQDTLDVVMLEGKGVYVENSAGLTDLVKGGDGTTVTGAAAAPKPLKPWSDHKLQTALKTVSW